MVSPGKTAGRPPRQPARGLRPHAPRRLARAETSYDRAGKAAKIKQQLFLWFALIKRLFYSLVDWIRLVGKTESMAIHFPIPLVGLANKTNIHVSQWPAVDYAIS